MSGLRLRAVAPALAAVALGCAGSRGSSDTPDSATVHAWLAWQAQSRPVYRIALSIPWTDLLAQLPAGDQRLRIILSATVLDRSGKSAGGKAWPAEVGAPAMDSMPARYERQVELSTQAGAQDLVVGIVVQGRAWGPEWRRRFDVPRLEPDALALGEPQFLRPAAAGAAADSTWLPYLERYYDDRTGLPRARAEIYDFAPAAAPDSYAVGFVVRDVQGRARLQGARAVARTGGVVPVEIELPVRALGTYELNLEVRSGTRVASARRRFEVGLSDLASLGVPGGERDLLTLLFTPAELDSLDRAAPAERERLWSEFWKRRDPDPSTPANERRDETVRRIRYANSHFTAAVPGWRTPRGRVYIELGAPDRVDALQNPNAVDRIERWTYGAGDRVFVFVDRDGRGDFELLRTNVAGWRIESAP